MIPVQRGEKRRGDVVSRATKRPVPNPVSSQSLQPDNPSLQSRGVADSKDNVNADLRPSAAHVSQDNSPAALASHSRVQSDDGNVSMTRRQGLARIFALNQDEDDRPLIAWHVETGECGGRLGKTVDPEGFASCSNRQHSLEMDRPRQHSLEMDRPGVEVDRLTDEWIASHCAQIRSRSIKPGTLRSMWRLTRGMGPMG